jgi:hypothetical protein
LLYSNVTIDELDSVGYASQAFYKTWGYSNQRWKMFQKFIISKYFHFYRAFWRSHMCSLEQTPQLLVCPESCSSDTPFEECTCSVPKLLNNETTWQNIFPCVIISDPDRELFQDFFPDNALKELTYILTTAPVLEGEMLESASPADILFWVIHPAIERMFAAKRLPGVTDMGGLEFVKWPNALTKHDFLSYSYYSLKAGENAFHPDAYTCAVSLCLI